MYREQYYCIVIFAAHDLTHDIIISLDNTKNIMCNIICTCIQNSLCINKYIEMNFFNGIF